MFLRCFSSYWGLLGKFLHGNQWLLSPVDLNRFQGDIHWKQVEVFTLTSFLCLTELVDAVWCICIARPLQDRQTDRACVSVITHLIECAGVYSTCSLRYHILRSPPCVYWIFVIGTVQHLQWENVLRCHCRCVLFGHIQCLIVTGYCNKITACCWNKPKHLACSSHGVTMVIVCGHQVYNV